MTTDLRFVFDTNTIISAVLLKKSISRKVFDEALAQGKLLISLDTLNELNRVLRRKKFNEYVTEQERLRFLSALLRETELITVTSKVNECRDPDDDKFLELAVSGQANYIVTGDKDLLVLHPFRNISIVKPNQLMDILIG